VQHQAFEPASISGLVPESGLKGLMLYPGP
jgi:hypothetical protein